MANPAMLSITDSAADRVRALVAKGDGQVEGLRIGVRQKGCSGLSYHLEYADGPQGMEDVVEAKGVKLFVDPTAVLFLFGTEIDYSEGKLESGFVFKNPNEKGRCGCGESFTV
jgi:iron-sulfur cluster assembly protein